MILTNYLSVAAIITGHHKKLQINESEKLSSTDETL